MLGVNHPGIASFYYNTGAVGQAKGELDGALIQFERTL